MVATHVRAFLVGPGGQVFSAWAAGSADGPGTDAGSSCLPRLNSANCGSSFFFAFTVIDLDFTHQLVHFRRVQKTTRRLQVRILSERLAFQRQQAGHFVFLPLLAILRQQHFAPTPASSLDRYPRRSPPVRERQRWVARPMMNVVFGFSIPFLLQFCADLLSQSVDVSTADRDLTDDAENLGGQLMRLYPDRPLARSCSEPTGCNRACPVSAPDAEGKIPATCRAVSNRFVVL